MTKKILLVVHRMNLGGTEKSLLSFLDSLDPRKYHVTVLLLEDGGLLRNQLPPWVEVKFLDGFDNIKPIINNPPLQLVKSNFQNLEFKQGFKNLIRYVKVKLSGNWFLNYQASLEGKIYENEADIAIAYAGPDNFISYYILRHVNAARKFQWIHFDVSKVLTDAKFGNRFYDEFDRFLCVSENAKYEFVRMFPKLERKTDVFENIVSDKFIKAQAEVGDTFKDNFEGLRIVTLGRLSSEKGQQMIPEVVKRLKENQVDFRWYLIGDGNLRQQLLDDIEKYNISNHLILLGSKVNPYGFLKNCDIYVQTSLHEGYCITLHEAKVFNKPVITTDFLSATNLIKNNEDGLIVDISEDGIYNGVKILIDNPEIRKTMACSRLIKEERSDFEYLLKF